MRAKGQKGAAARLGQGVLLWVLLGAGGPLMPAAFAAVENADCLACHGDPSLGRFVDPAQYDGSIHGKNRCISCHTDVAEMPHPVPLKKVSCATCHPIEAEIYLASDHGIALQSGITEAAACVHCHGNAHALLSARDPGSPVARSNIPATCAQCHGQVEEMAKFRLNQAAPVASYTKSVHGIAHQEGMTQAAVCTDCHGSHYLHRATNPASKLFWQNIPATCGRCHENIRQAYLRSVHGRSTSSGKRDAPVCTDCHGEHSIAMVKQAESKVSPAHIPETCGQCHSAERIVTKYRLPAHVVETYLESYHGLALQLGSVTAANCASCHGAHDILPSADPRSSVNPANLAKTCGRCHAGVSAQVAKGQIHSGPRPGLEHQVVSFVRNFYLFLIVLLVGGMLLHNGLDFLKKFRSHYRETSALGTPDRMALNERIQHGILAVVFSALAYTGFALKFPQAWWASPFVGQGDWRGFSHRAAALLFVGLAAYHAWFVFFTRRGQKHLKELLPRRADFVQPFQMLWFYLGFRRERPIFGRYGYVEKMEYWALVWGSILMTLTGTLMVRTGWTLRLFPKWFFDVVTAIHYYEAILACLAIVVWHFYFTVFDPDEYPMKGTWISGRPSKADQAHRHEKGTE